MSQNLICWSVYRRLRLWFLFSLMYRSGLCKLWSVPDCEPIRVLRGKPMARMSALRTIKVWCRCWVVCLMLLLFDVLRTWWSCWWGGVSSSSDIESRCKCCMFSFRCKWWNGASVVTREVWWLLNVQCVTCLHLLVVELLSFSRTSSDSCC